MRIHQWQVRGPDRTVKELLPEAPPTVVGHGILGDSMLNLTARRSEVTQRDREQAPQAAEPYRPSPDEPKLTGFEKVMANFNQRYAVVNESGKALVYERHSPDSGRLAPESAERF